MQKERKTKKQKKQWIHNFWFLNFLMLWQHSYGIGKKKVRQWKRTRQQKKAIKKDRETQHEDR